MKTTTGTLPAISRRSFCELLGGAALSSSAFSVFGQSLTTVSLNVYKEESCGCCVNWISHMEQHGFVATVHHPENLNVIKDELGVLPAWQSCHTTVSEEGFLFEGHVPAKYITQFLAAPPDHALGLAVPGMPMSSRGMEVGNQFSAYDVLLLRKDGSAEVYVSVKSAADH